MKDPKKDWTPADSPPGDGEPDARSERPDEADYPGRRSETPGDGNPGSSRREDTGRDRPEMGDA